MAEITLTRETMDAHLPSAVCHQDLRDRAEAYIADKNVKMGALIRVALDFYLRTHSTESEFNTSISEQPSAAGSGEDEKPE